MPKPKHIRSLCAALLIALTAVVTAPQALGQSKENKSVKLPAGNYSLRVLPFVGPGYDSIPVVVFSTTSDLPKGAAVTEVGIENRSGRAVTAVRFGWRLSTEQNREAVLLQGQTPLLALRNTLLPGNSVVVLYQVTSLARIHEPLLKNGTLNGNFSIEVMVSEIHYEDGSPWAKTNSARANIVKAAHVSPPAPGPCRPVAPTRYAASTSIRRAGGFSTATATPASSAPTWATPATTSSVLPGGEAAGRSRQQTSR